MLADDILKNVEYDALRIVYNKFHSVVSFIPTVSTILSPEVLIDSILLGSNYLASAISNEKIRFYLDVIFLRWWRESLNLGGNLVIWIPMR